MHGLAIEVYRLMRTVRHSLVPAELRPVHKAVTIPGAIRILWLGIACVCAYSALAVDAQPPAVRPEEVALGRALFNDPLLSFDGTMACVTCHVPEQGFTVNGSATAVGRGGKSGPVVCGLFLGSCNFREVPQAHTPAMASTSEDKTPCTRCVKRDRTA